MIHDSEIGLESKVPNVQPPSAHGGLETFTRFAWASAVVSLVMIKSIWLVPVLLFGA